MSEEKVQEIKKIKVKIESYELNLFWADLEKLIKHLEDNHLGIIFKVHVIESDYFEV